MDAVMNEVTNDPCDGSLSLRWPVTVVRSYCPFLWDIVGVHPQYKTNLLFCPIPNDRTFSALRHAGIEPATFRFVEQCLNHCATISGPLTNTVHDNYTDNWANLLFIVWLFYRAFFKYFHFQTLSVVPNHHFMEHHRKIKGILYTFPIAQITADSCSAHDSSLLGCDTS
jgi:hypothetical protein